MEFNPKDWLNGKNWDIKGKKLSETINSLLIQRLNLDLTLKQLEGRLAQWVVSLTRNRSDMSFNPIQGFHCFLEQEFHPNSLVLVGSEMDSSMIVIGKFVFLTQSNNLSIIILWYSIKVYNKDYCVMTW